VSALEPRKKRMTLAERDALNASLVLLAGSAARLHERVDGTKAESAEDAAPEVGAL
jgi:hypothetical protein